MTIWKNVRSWFRGREPLATTRQSGQRNFFFSDLPRLSDRRWRLLQVEPTLACNLACIMCPWTAYREEALHRGIMQPHIWEAVKPALKDAQWIDFTGGGEPLLQPRLPQWMHEAKQEGCIVGLLSNGLLLNPELAEKLIEAGIDWICFSMDSPEKAHYERIRVGSNFDVVYRNIKHFSEARAERTKIMLNYVMMRSNFHQIQDMVQLASKLGIDQINFKQCEVIRGVHGKDMGLFGDGESREMREREKALAAACDAATKLGIATVVTPFFPEERCVCEQDPRDSMFIRFDGVVSPCINLANGGSTTFLGREVQLPHVAYGTLPQDTLSALWESEVCMGYRIRFTERCRQYNNVFIEGLIGDARPTPKRLLETAIRRMPRPPSGCEVCHYLYGL